MRRDKLQGLIIRSKSNWVEQGEKPTRYFLNLESRNYLNKTIKRVDCNGNIITNQKEILAEVKNFYENLYSSREEELIDVDLDQELESFPIPKLDKSRSDSLESPITESELLSVLKNMKNGKSPGSDGFTAEFFKFFWHDLKIYILNAVNTLF